MTTQTLEMAPSTDWQQRCGRCRDRLNAQDATAEVLLIDSKIGTEAIEIVMLRRALVHTDTCLYGSDVLA